MPYPIEDKLVIGVASNALFDLKFEDAVFREKGLKAYNEHQNQNRQNPLKKGIAFPFIRRFLGINEVFPKEKPVEVVLLSRNSPETGLRIFNSIAEHKLDISRAGFTSGNPPFKYINAFNISLFLTTNGTDVEDAIKLDFPAGKVLDTKISDDEKDRELRVAFDFDGVIADDESESVYTSSGQLNIFHDYEKKHTSKPHNPGSLADFFKKLSNLQKLQNDSFGDHEPQNKILRTAIITARNAPAHERAIHTLESWGVSVDEMFLLGGIEKNT
jgi:5'-nucleotidase